jgi:hypothetical protein
VRAAALADSLRVAPSHLSPYVAPRTMLRLVPGREGGSGCLRVQRALRGRQRFRSASRERNIFLLVCHRVDPTAARPRVIRIDQQIRRRRNRSQAMPARSHLRGGVSHRPLTPQGPLLAFLESFVPPEIWRAQ